MTPEYTEGFFRDPDAAFLDLMTLDWLQVRQSVPPVVCFATAAFVPSVLIV